MNIFPIITTKTRNLKWDHYQDKIFGMNRKGIAGILILAWKREKRKENSLERGRRQIQKEEGKVTVKI